MHPAYLLFPRIVCLTSCSHCPKYFLYLGKNSIINVGAPWNQQFPLVRLFLKVPVICIQCHQLITEYPAIMMSRSSIQVYFSAYY